MKKEIVDGMEIKTLQSGHVIKMPVQAEGVPVEPEPVPIDVDAITESEFRKMVLTKLGIKCK